MNFKLTTTLLAFLFLANAIYASNVIVATDKTFDDIVLNSGKTSFVKFFADWCSHCKRMAPAFEEVADLFAGNSDEIQLVEINGDENRKIANRYDIEGFPSLKLFMKDDVKNPVEYSGGRDSESFENFISSASGVKVYKPKVVSHVKSVDDYSFDKEVLEDDRAHFLVFTASWCGHCKNLKPEWLKLAEVYANDNDTVVVSEILTTDVEAEELKKRYEVQGFPTILYFDKGKKGSPEPYNGARDLESLVSFINDKTGLERDTNGQLTDKAGLIKNFDISGIISSEDKITRAEEMLKQLDNYNTTDVAYYRKLLNKIIADQEEFFVKETSRLEKILSKSNNLAQPKIDSIKKRLNVLKSFLAKTEEVASNLLHDEF